MFRFRFLYFMIALTIFLIEVFIALHVHDNFIRPFVGDVLVVMLIYCFLRSFINMGVWKTAIIVLIFSFFIETLQYFKIVELLGLEHSAIARTVIGTSFAWHDLLAYTIGIILILLTEKTINRSMQ